LKILPLTHFKDPKAAILTLKMLKMLKILKNDTGAACEMLILAHFPCIK